MKFFQLLYVCNVKLKRKKMKPKCFFDVLVKWNQQHLVVLLIHFVCFSFLRLRCARRMTECVYVGRQFIFLSSVVHFVCRFVISSVEEVREEKGVIGVFGFLFVSCVLFDIIKPNGGCWGINFWWTHNQRGEFKNKHYSASKRKLHIRL